MKEILQTLNGLSASSLMRRGSVWCGVAQLWCCVAQYGAAWLSMVRHGSVWCGVAQYGVAWLSYDAAWLSMVRRGSVGSASACCKAGLRSILGSAPPGGFSYWAYEQCRYGERPRRMATDKCIVCMKLNEFIEERPDPKGLSTLSQCTESLPHRGLEVMSSRSGVWRSN